MTWIVVSGVLCSWLCALIGWLAGIASSRKAAVRALEERDEANAARNVYAREEHNAQCALIDARDQNRALVLKNQILDRTLVDLVTTFKKAQAEWADVRESLLYDRDVARDALVPSVGVSLLPSQVYYQILPEHLDRWRSGVPANVPVYLHEPRQSVHWSDDVTISLHSEWTRLGRLVHVDFEKSRVLVDSKLRSSQYDCDCIDCEDEREDSGIASEES